MRVRILATLSLGLLPVALCSLITHPTEAESSTSSDDDGPPTIHERSSNNWHIACNADGDVCWFTDGIVKAGMRPRDLVSCPHNLGIKTRCSPENSNTIQRFTGNGWVHMYTCEEEGSCHELGGLGACYMSNHISVIPVLHHLEVRQAPSNNEPNPVARQHATRCNPLNNREVQYFDGKEWLIAFACEHESTCDGVQGIGICQPLAFATRCNPNQNTEIQHFNGRQWISHSICPYPGSCVDLNGVGSCHLGNNRYQSPPHHERRSIKQRQVPDLHSVDTRCNPQNLSEVQAFDGTQWITHFVCPEDSTCKDLEGMGACHLQGTTYLVPAYNDTSHIMPPIRDPPYRRSTRCNPKNGTESQTWNGTAWNLDGVCFSPFQCYDFDGDAGFTICAHPTDASRSIWRPLPPDAAPALATIVLRTVISKCKNGREIVHWTGSSWAHHRTCSPGWRCRSLDISPHHAVCYASSLASVMHHINRRDDLWLSSSSDDSCSELSDSVYPPGYPKLCPTAGQHDKRKARVIAANKAARNNASDIETGTSSSSDEEGHRFLGTPSVEHGKAEQYAPKDGLRQNLINPIKYDLFSTASKIFTEITDGLQDILPTFAPRYEGMHARRVANQNKVADGECCSPPSDTNCYCHNYDSN